MMVWKLNRSHCAVFLSEFMLICARSRRLGSLCFRLLVWWSNRPRAEVKRVTKIIFETKDLCTVRYSAISNKDLLFCSFEVCRAPDHHSFWQTILKFILLRVNRIQRGHNWHIMDGIQAYGTEIIRLNSSSCSKTKVRSNLPRCKSVVDSTQTLDLCLQLVFYPD
jgi:hypothetical protein